MGLRLWLDGERVRGEVTLDRRHEGAPGFAHGGAVATVLDDALGTLLAVLRRPAVTAKLDVDYRRPAFLGRRFTVETWVERSDGRKLWLAGEMREGEELVAEAHALFLAVSIEHFAEGIGESADRWRERAERTGMGLPW